MAQQGENTIWTSGRRKTAIARVTVRKGDGSIVFNDNQTLSECFPLRLDQERVLRPFRVSGRDVKGYDISIKLEGGGKKAQIDASALGLAKALEDMEPNLRPLLKDAGLLTRDPRMKERKKVGLKRARKAPQFTKR